MANHTVRLSWSAVVWRCRFLLRLWVLGGYAVPVGVDVLVRAQSLGDVRTLLLCCLAGGVALQLKLQP